MSRRERKSYAKALIRRLEEDKVRTINARNIAQDLRNLSNEPSTDMFHFLNLIGFEGYRVPKATMASSLATSLTSGTEFTWASSRTSGTAPSSVASSRTAGSGNLLDEIAAWDTWTIRPEYYYSMKKSAEPKLLCIVVDRSERMVSSWTAVKESVRAEIAVVKSQGPVRTSITVVDEAVLHLVKFDKAVSEIPEHVRIGSGCAIMDGVAAQIEAAVDYTRTSRKYANNIEILIYTKGVDTASTRIVSMEKLAKVIDAAASIGYKIRIMDPSARSMAHKLGFYIDRQVVKTAGPVTKLLADLKENK